MLNLRVNERNDIQCAAERNCSHQKRLCDKSPIIGNCLREMKGENRSDDDHKDEKDGFRECEEGYNSFQYRRKVQEDQSKQDDKWRDKVLFVKHKQLTI